ncbi:pyruvate kinase, partial [Prescottella equi]
MRRTKIVCTLGPATASGDRVRELVESGMDVARLNFSHGEHADHQDNYRRVRAASE